MMPSVKHFEDLSALLTRVSSIAMVLLALLTTSAVAADDNKYVLSQITYKALTQAQKALAEDKFSQARSQLESLLSKVDKGGYEQAVVLQNLAYVYSSTQHYSKAIKQFQSALALKALPAEVELNLLFNLGQLQLAEQQYKPGIANIEKWLKQQASPAVEVYVSLASANYQIKRYKPAISYISKAIKKQAKPDEAWYQLLFSAHLELKQYAAAAKVLEKLIQRDPANADYWQQLSYVYSRQKKELRSLSVAALVNKLDLTSSSQTLLNLIGMYRYLGLPFKAGTLLEQGLNAGVIVSNFKQLNTLADCWLAAKQDDKAIAVLSSLAKQDPSGDSDLKLGRIYMQSEQWQNAISSLQQSINKNTSQQGLAHLLLGTAYFYLDQLEQAKQMFKTASRSSKYKRQASQWLGHISQVEASL